MDVICMAQIILGQMTENSKKVYTNVINFERTFNSITTSLMWKKTKPHEIPQHT